MPGTSRAGVTDSAVCRDCGRPYDDHKFLASVLDIQRRGYGMRSCRHIGPWKQWDRYEKFSRQELDEIDRNKRKAARER